MYIEIVYRDMGAPDIVMGCLYHGGGHHTLNVAARPQVGLLPLRHRAAGYEPRQGHHPPIQ